MLDIFLGEFFSSVSKEKQGLLLSERVKSESKGNGKRWIFSTREGDQSETGCDLFKLPFKIQGKIRKISCYFLFPRFLVACTGQLAVIRNLDKSRV